jgi:hypothetical protein
LKLHLGFENKAYKSQPTKAKVVGTPYGQGKTTAEVAADLETRYGIVEKFFELEEENIVEMLEESFSEDIEDVMTMKQPSRKGFSDKDTDKIEVKFRARLQREELHSRGRVPTLAAQKGVSHLRSDPNAKNNPPRPSFIDTGMYQQSFKVWVEDMEE